MPEMLEVESYRRQAEAVIGRTVAEVDARDAWFVKGGEPDEVVAAVTGLRVLGVRRRGKLLVLDLAGEDLVGQDLAGEGVAGAGSDAVDSSGARVAPDVRLGLRFGMTGRLIVDGAASIDRLEYSSGRDEAAWDRFALRFTDGTDLRIRDPRRLGGVSLDPDEDRLGVDAGAATRDDLADALGASTAPLKARIMDQSRLAGIGNLLADEILWRAGLDPARPAGGLAAGELSALHRALGGVLADLRARGGSHTGDLRSGVLRDGLCPRDGAPLVRRRVGGRTTWSCPVHQK